jgi:hypothetical protein
VTERPKPDIDHTREALREHDERVEEDERDEPEPAPDEPDTPDEDT